MIPYSRQDINKKDIDNVVRVLKGDFLTQGNSVERFENSLKKKVRVNHAISVNSASSALLLACIVLGLKKNDHFWAVPNTYVASVNCGLHCDAKLDFVDIDPNNLNISSSLLEKKLIKAKRNNKLPKIIIITDFAGLPSCSSKIKTLSKKYNFKIIQDASHSLGAKYNGEYIGNCKYSDITVFSFHPVKIITTGEGGMITTNNKRMAEKLRILRSGGIKKNLTKNLLKNTGKWFYQQIDLGFNFRLTDIQCALGCSQLNRLDKFVKKRRLIANNYIKNFFDLPIKIQSENLNSISSYHLFTIQVKKNIRTKLFDKLRSKGIYVNVHYIPIHTHPFIKSLGFKKNDYPNSTNYYNGAISIPIYPSLSNKEQNYIIGVIKSFF